MILRRAKWVENVQNLVTRHLHLLDEQITPEIVITKVIEETRQNRDQRPCRVLPAMGGAQCFGLFDQIPLTDRIMHEFNVDGGIVEEDDDLLFHMIGAHFHHGRCVDASFNWVS